MLLLLIKVSFVCFPTTVAKFGEIFGDLPEILETSWDFWKVFGNLPEIFHPFATLFPTSLVLYCQMCINMK